MKKKKINVFSTAMVFLIILLTMFPFYIMLVGSFKPPISLITFPIDLNPFTDLTVKNVVTVWEKSDILL